jgi:MFS family permease
LLAGFVLWENRTSEPLMRFEILRTKTVLGANVAGFILGTALFSMFLMLTLYMQQVLHYSPMKTGVAYLAVAGTSIIWANVAAALVSTVGVRPLIATGMGLLAVGMLYFTRIDVGGTYLTALLPGFLIIAVGMAMCFVPISIAALAGVGREEAGLASGLINTTQQIGGAVGIALLSTIAITRTESKLAAGTAVSDAMVGGFQLAFLVGAAIAAAGLVAALLLIRDEELTVETQPEPEQVLDAV